MSSVDEPSPDEGGGTGIGPGDDRDDVGTDGSTEGADGAATSATGSAGDGERAPDDGTSASSIDAAGRVRLDESDETTEDVHETNRWRGAVGVALAAVVVGVAMNRAALLLVGVVGVAYVTYPRLFDAPEAELELERTVDTRTPDPGDVVEISVTVTNAGDSWLPDCRLVDGVPETLTVVDGSPRRGACLPPGRSASFTYAVRAERGTHGFEPATVAVRDVSGAAERECTVATETELECTELASSAPVRTEQLSYVGTVLSNRGGTGTEFFRTREYQHGDPMRRIDWNRFARTNELTTVEYREERAATAVLLVDAREPAYRGRAEDPHAVAASTSAAGQVLRALVRDRNRIGLAILGRELGWVAPGTGSDHAADIRGALSTHPALASTPPRNAPETSEQVESLRRRLPADAQVVLFSPLCDDDVVRAARTLEASSHPVSVVSPDVTTDDTAGGRLARIERTNRITELRTAEVPVVDWDPAEPLSSAVVNAMEARSR